MKKSLRLLWVVANLASSIISIAVSLLRTAASMASSKESSQYYQMKLSIKRQGGGGLAKICRRNSIKRTRTKLKKKPVEGNGSVYGDRARLQPRRRVELGRKDGCLSITRSRIKWRISWWYMNNRLDWCATLLPTEISTKCAYTQSTISRQTFTLFWSKGRSLPNEEDVWRWWRTSPSLRSKMSTCHHCLQ